MNHIRRRRNRGTVKLRLFSGPSLTNGKSEDDICLKAYMKELWVKICPVLQTQNQLDLNLLYRILVHFSTDLRPHDQKIQSYYIVEMK